MKLRNYIILFLLFTPCMKSYSQHDEKNDSIWVSEQLEKGTLHINPKYLKAMKDGTLINAEQSLDHSPSELSILKDFSEYLNAVDTPKALQLDSLPPAVFLLYSVDTMEQRINGLAYKPTKSLVLKDQIRLGKSSFYIQVGAQNLYMEEVKDGQRRGSVGSSVTLNFSLENTLRSIFWASERNKKRNRKRESTWKYYNAY